MNSIKDEMLILGVGEFATQMINELPEMNNTLVTCAVREPKRYKLKQGVKLRSLKNRSPWKDLYIPDSGAIVLSDLSSPEHADELVKLSRKFASKKIFFLLVRPHRLEGDMKVNRANQMMERLQYFGATILCLDEKVMFTSRNMHIRDAFENMKKTVSQSMAYFIDMFRDLGPMRIKIEDLRNLLKGSYGVVNFAVGKGPRTKEATEDLFGNKLLGDAIHSAKVGLLYMRLSSDFSDLNALYDIGQAVESHCAETCEFLRGYGEREFGQNKVELLLALIRLVKLDEDKQEKVKASSMNLHFDEDLLNQYLRQDNLANVVKSLKKPSYKRLNVKVQ